MANLHYQQLQTQQTEKGILKAKKQKQSSCYIQTVISDVGLAFDLPSP